MTWPYYAEGKLLATFSEIGIVIKIDRLECTHFGVNIDVGTSSYVV